MNALKNAARLAAMAASASAGELDAAALPGRAWFAGDKEIFTRPRDDGDCRYPYGSDGFNFWAYTSGYMHSNEGIFSPFLRSAEGQEPKLCWFAGFPTEAGNKIVPLLAVPETEDDAVRYTVFNKSFVTYMCEAEGLRLSVRVYVTGDRTTRFTLGVENLTEKEIDFFISSYCNPFLLHDVFENGENRWFREVSVAAGENLPDFVVRCNESISRTRQVSNYGVLTRTLTLNGGAALKGHEETTSRAAYVGGARSSLHHPRGVLAGTFGEAPTVTTFTEVGICGDILRLTMPAGASLRVDSAFAYRVHCENGGAVEELRALRPDPAAFDADLAALIQAEEAKSGGLTMTFEDGKEDSLSAEVMNAFVEQLKKQVEFCATIKGYIQLSAGSLIGIRDVFQALEGYMIWQPEAARAKMLEALSFTDPSGRCPRQYALPVREGAAPAMDLRPFIDQGVWVISTIVTYLKLTGDFGFLGEVCGYYEIVDEKKRLVKKSEEQDTVLDHMLRIMNWLLDKTDPRTGCIRVLFGDWNDTLDGLGTSRDPDKEYGSGVSVMAASQVWQNLNEMMALLSLLNADKYSDTITDYSERADRLAAGLQKYGIVYNDEGQARISHGWGDELSYHVGGWNDPDGVARRSLTSNAFWVLSGLYDRDTGLRGVIEKDILALDSKYGLRTFEPHFEPDAKGVGRIPKLPAGTAENGAPYIHASVFGVMALFRMGSPEAAWQELIKSLPMTHDTISVSPYVMPNSYGYNPEKNVDGQSMMDWQTGSSNVTLKLLVRFVAGVRPEYDGVWVQPAAYCPFGAFTAEVPVKGAVVRIRYKQTGAGKRRFTVDGEPAEGRYNDILKAQRLWIPANRLKGTIEVTVED